jgi:hypothetical protein
VAETIAADDSDGAKLLVASFQAPELLAVGRPGEVIALLEPLIPVMERSDPETEVWVRLQLGKAYSHQQRYTQAIRHAMPTAVPRVRRAQARARGAAGTRHRLSRPRLARPCPDGLEEGLPKAETMASNEKAAFLACGLADYWQRHGDDPAAAELFARSAQAFEYASQHFNRAGALDRLARVRLDMGTGTARRTPGPWR